MTWAFSNEKAQRPFLREQTLVALANPLNELMALLRGTLVPGLLAAVARNRNLGATRVRLFEVGRVFREAAGGPVKAAWMEKMKAQGLPAEELYETVTKALADFRAQKTN